MASIKDWVLKKEASDDDPLDEIEDSLEEMRPTGDESEVLAQIEQTLEEMENRKEAEIQDHVDIIIDAFNVLKDKVEARIAGIERIEPEKGDPGPRGEQGRDGRDGADGTAGRDGADGRNGVDGRDGVGVSDAKIDFDGSLVITLTDGRELNVGEVVPFDVAEKIRVITSNGGYSGGGASLPDQTGNAGKYLTTDGTNPSWGTVSGTGSVTSVDVSGGTTGLTTSGGPVTSSGTITLAGTLAVANGGTGATDGSGARTNLSAQKTITSGTALPTGGVDGDIYLATGTTAGTINLLTQTSGATANQLMYGGASGEVAQTANMAWDNASSLLTVKNRLQVINAGGAGVEFDSSGIKRISTASSNLLIKGWQNTSGGAAVGGDVTLAGGNATVSGDGGNLFLNAGLATGSGPGTNGGNITAAASPSGLTDTAGQGGFVQFQAGDSYGASGQAGAVNFTAGNSNTSGGTAGPLSFAAGYCTTSGAPGDILFSVGGTDGASTAVGNIYIGSTFGDPVAVTAGTGTTHAADLPVNVDGTQYYIRLYS